MSICERLHMFGFGPNITLGGRKFLLSLIIMAAAVCLVLGVTLPIVKLDQLYIFSDEHSLVSIVQALYQDDEIFLSAIIVIFSIFIPVLKLVYLLAAATISENDDAGREQILKRMEWLGKWSMLDVLVLALIIFYAKSSGIADATSMPGLYLFTASVVLTMLAYGWVKGSEQTGVSSSRPEGSVQPSERPMGSEEQ